MGADVPFSRNHSLFFQNSCVQAKLMKMLSLQKLSRLKIWFNLSQNSKENVIVAENILFYYVKSSFSSAFQLKSNITA